MTLRHGTAGRLLLILAAVATFAMHAGVTGACMGQVISPHPVSDAAATTHLTTSEHPLMPQDVPHAPGKLCQARLPSGVSGTGSSPAPMAVVAPIAGTTAAGAPLRLIARDRGQPAPQQSSLCVWRI